MAKFPFPAVPGLTLALLLLVLGVMASPASAQPGDDGAGPDPSSATDGGGTPASGDSGESGTGDGDSTGDSNSDPDPDSDPGADSDGGSGGDTDTPPPVTLEGMRTENAKLRDQLAAARKELADVQDIRKPEAPDTPGTNVEASIRLATIITVGNSSSVTLDGGVNLTVENPYEFEFSHSVNFQFIESNGVTEQNRVFQVLGANYLPNDTFSPFVYLSHGFEEKRKVTYELNTGLGLKYTPFRDPWDPTEYDKEGRYKYSLSLAVILDHQQFQPLAATDHRTFIRLSVWVKGEQKLADGLFLKNKFSFLPAVEDFTDWSIANRFSINVVIEKRYTINFTWSFKEDSTPVPGVDRVDQEFLIGINIKLK
jgi:Protein of unknown function, DUF481